MDDGIQQVTDEMELEAIRAQAARVQRNGFIVAAVITGASLLV